MVNAGQEAPVSRVRAMLLVVRATPAAMAGMREPCRAMTSPASGAQAAIAAGIGQMARAARSADIDRASCRYRLDRNPAPASAAMPHVPIRQAPVNEARRNKP